MQDHPDHRLASGAVFGLIALLLIESLRLLERALRRFERHPYLLAAAGRRGAGRCCTWSPATRYAGLGTDTINGVLAGTMQVVAAAPFSSRSWRPSITLETGGSGGIVTPIFFIGATSGAALAPVFGVPPSLLAAFGFVAVLAAAANTPIAAAVMAMELLPPRRGCMPRLRRPPPFSWSGIAASTPARSSASPKSAGLDVPLGGAIGDVDRAEVRIRKGTLTERVHNLGRSREPPTEDRGER